MVIPRPSPVRARANRTSLRLASIAALVLSTFGLSGCVWDEKILRLEQQQTQLRSDLTASERRLEAVESRADAQAQDLRAVLALTLCKNQWARDLVESCANRTCDSHRVSEALKNMRSQPHVLAYFAPDGLDKLHPDRRKQFSELFSGTHVANPRVILITLGSSAALNERAGVLGSQLREKLMAMTRTGAIRGAQNTGYLPAFSLGCSKHEQDLANEYSRNSARDRPLAGEPNLDKPHINAWIFLLDC